MKKILIAILITLLIILTYIVLARSISIAGFKIDSISNIKSASENLNQNVDKANSLVDETYPDEMTTLEDAIKNLKIAKQKYESKNIYNVDETELGALHVDTYKIHYLWTRLGNYRKDRGVRSLNLDLKTTQTADVYDLQFTLIGTYSSIIEFLYDIEGDEELNFEPKNFTITSDLTATTTTQTNVTGINTGLTNTNSNTNSNANTTNNNTNNTNTNNANAQKKEQKSDGINLKATFTVENVGITLD